MMSAMRTTVTLESDVARLLTDQARRTRQSFKETLNAAVRLGLSRGSESSAGVRFALEAQAMRLKAGLDSGHLNSLLDELATDAFIDKARVDNQNGRPS